MPDADVLLIDASKPSRYALRLQLQALGARVRQAQSIEEALPQLEQRPDLIVTASALPGMNAIELLELLSAQRHSAPPVVIHTPDGHWPLAASALRQGARAVLATDELRRALPSLLRNLPSPALPDGAPPAPQAAAARVMAVPAELPIPPAGLPAAPAPAAALPTPASFPVLLAGCWLLTVPALVLGLLLGLWIG